MYLKVPLAPLWAVLAALFQFIPHFGPIFTFIGPAVAASFSGGLEVFLWLLGLYGVIILLDGLLLQPLIMKRTARVPLWASLAVPILLSFMLRLLGRAACGTAVGGYFRLSRCGQEARARGR